MSPSSKNKADKHQHKKEYDPIYFGSGEVKPNLIVMNEHLTKKERKMVEKLEAQIEYEEAHEHPTEAQKLRERIDTINDNAETKYQNKAVH